ncbi:ABZJ_00895 family protein [Pseudomonas sp. G34]|jgi:drug/metabolite transporter (DMT)-like permease|uniref:ABZJ_00895 family protein n=1 Tax=Pseudomonas sp. G34 TaxID=3059083 RepID=UPI002809B66B|nr:ABZJ_00895 family protein [Pseudomonas sp. G34]MDQ7984180.1 ABZJ_00895 family protein [Pseudomonas sp. G34]
MPPSHQPVAMLRYALIGVVAAVVLNVLLRSFVKLGGVLATLVIAASIAALMALLFAWQQRRPPTRGERRRLVGLYAGMLAVLYAGLLTLMTLQDEPSPMGVLIFILHYLSYPLLAQMLFSERIFKRTP